MPSLDVFNQDAFSTIQLTNAIERIPHNPMRVQQLVGFTPRPSRTTTIMVEERDGVLRLIPTTPRGAPPIERETEKRKVRSVMIPRIAKGDTIYAEELQNIRGFGSETDTMAVQAEVQRRLTGPVGLRAEMNYTWEHMALGAVQGVVLDADNTTEIENWFDFFEITPPTPISFELEVAGTDVRGKCTEIRRNMQRAAKGAPFGGIHALCGDQFYDELRLHPQVRETVKVPQDRAAMDELRNNGAFDTFSYGGITFENYQGSDDNTAIAIATTEAKFFPVNAPSVWQVAYGPGESMEWVNQLGRPEYAVTFPDRDRNFWQRIELYSYPLFMCLRPEMLQTATNT